MILINKPFSLTCFSFSKNSTHYSLSRYGLNYFIGCILMTGVTVVKNLHKLLWNRFSLLSLVLFYQNNHHSCNLNSTYLCAILLRDGIKHLLLHFNFSMVKWQSIKWYEQTFHSRWSESFSWLSYMISSAINVLVVGMNHSLLFFPSYG